MKVISTLLFLSYTLLGVTQESYYKEIQLEEGLHVTGFHMLTTHTDIYISGKTRCLDTLGSQYTCMSLSKHSLDGEIVWHTSLPWCNSANEGAMSLLNDTLIVSGHSVDDQNRLFIDFFNLDGEHLKHEEINYNTLYHPTGFYNNGQILLDRNLYIQCETGNLDDVTTTVTTKYNIDTGAHTHWDLHIDPIGTPVTAGYDFCMDIDSNFLAISEMSRVNGELTDIKQITKFDKDGNILAKYFGPDYDMTSDVRPEMTVLQNGNYVFLHNIDAFIQDRVPQVVCLNPNTEEILWTYDYESTMDTLRLPNVSQLITAANGDIIGAGSDSQLELHGGYSYYFFRINSTTGEMLWERTFQRQDDQGEFMRGGFRDVKELSDGSILGMGTDGNSHIALMRISADGCLTYMMDTYCDENNFLGMPTSAVSAVAELGFGVYPNPTSGLVRLSGLPLGSRRVAVYDMQGRVVYSSTTNPSADLELDLSYLDSGLYVVKIYDMDGILIGLKKVMIER